LLLLLLGPSRVVLRVVINLVHDSVRDDRNRLRHGRLLSDDSLHVMALLGARLAERGSDYHVVFDALATLVGEPADIEDIRRQVATEGPDQTVVNMDQIWEEEAVTFLANQEGCGVNRSMPGAAQPVQWVPRPGSMQPPAHSL
jgi:nitrate reductase delta subunit